MQRTVIDEARFSDPFAVRLSRQPFVVILSKIPFVVSLSKIPFVVSLSKIPFVVSLSNHALGEYQQGSGLATITRTAWFDRLTTNGFI